MKNLTDFPASKPMAMAAPWPTTPPPATPPPQDASISVLTNDNNVNSRALDVLGRVITNQAISRRSGNTLTTTIRPPGTLAPGLYWLTIRADGQVLKTIKVVK